MQLLQEHAGNLMLDTLRPHYNTPHCSAVSVITRPHDGTQILSNKNAL